MPQQKSMFELNPLVPDDIGRNTPFESTWDLFKTHLVREGKTENTWRAFEADLKVMREFFDGKFPVGQFTTTRLNQFLDWMESKRGKPCSRKTYARRVTTVKVYFGWLYHLEVLGHDPAKPILQRSGPAPLSEVLSPKQIETALAFTLTMRRKEDHDYRPELLFRLLLDTGIKKSEAMRLLPGDVDHTNPDHPLVHVRHKTRDVYKERRIPLEPEWVDLLDLYLEQYAPKTEIFECTPRNLEYVLADIGEGAQIPFKVSFEVMRWTSAVRDHLNGVDEQRIREKMGLSESSWYETGQKVKKLAERVEREDQMRI